MPVSEDPSLKSFLRKKRDRYAVSGRGLSGKILSMLFPADIIKSYSGIPLYSRILDVGCGSGTSYLEIKGSRIYPCYRN